MFPSYKNQSVDLRANQLTSFYMMGTLVDKQFIFFYIALTLSLKGTLTDKIHSIDANMFVETETSIIQTHLFRKKKLQKLN